MDWMYFFELAVNGALAGLMYALVAMGIIAAAMLAYFKFRRWI